MAAFLDLCRFTPTTGGTGDWIYSASVAPCLSPAAAGAVNGTVYKVIAVSNDLSQMEITEGAYSSSTGTFARTTVLFNSSGTGTRPGQSGAGTKINFATVPQVAVIGIKEDLISIEEANSFSANQKAQARANIDALKKNYIVNGAMMVSQENGTTPGATGSYYPVDQFQLQTATSGVLSVQQAASLTPSGSPNRLRATVTTADTSVDPADIVYLLTMIEGKRIADLKFGNAAAKTITLQFGVKAPAGTYCVAFWNATGGRAYIAEYTIAAGEANTDVVKSVTVAADVTGTWASDNTAGLLIFWCVMTGSNEQGTPGSWSSTGRIGTSNQFNLLGNNGNVFELFDVGLYEGAAAPSFQVPDYSRELADCQRYFWIRNGLAANDYFNNLECIGTNTFGGNLVTFPVQMRTAPTMSISAASDLAVTNSAGSPQTCASLGTLVSSIYGSKCTGAVSGSPFTAGNVGIICFLAASGWIKANARM